MPRLRHVVFDWNGTLLDDVGLAAECTSRVLVARGHAPIDWAAYRQHFCFPIRRFYEHLGVAFADDADFERLMGAYLQLFDERALGCSLHAGAAELFEALTARGVGLSILSSTQAPTLRQAVSRFSLERYVSNVLGLESLDAAGKHDLARGLQARLDLPAESVWYVGDTDHDMEIAALTGWRPFLVSFGHQASPTGPAATRLERLGEILEHADRAALLSGEV
jgi:phosphoglycolate phosphatase